jgi:membrane protein implicated in regulation of membrane protease activity
MTDESEDWNELAKLWHAEAAGVSVDDVEQLARRQRRQMWWLAVAEGGALLLAFVVALGIAIQTAFVVLPALSMVFFGICGYLQHRMRREPPPSGGEDLLTSLDTRIARETWNLAQLAVGRAVTFVTLFGIVMLASGHLRHYATTPPARMSAILAIASIVLAILAWNLWFTQVSRRRKQRLDGYAAHMRETA